MTNREIATKIFNKLKDSSAPGKSTWGDDHPKAHAELFGTDMRRGYEEDMIEDIVKILDIETAHATVIPPLGKRV